MPTPKPRRGWVLPAADYARFLIEVIEPKPSDPFRLSKASLDEMLRPQVQVEHTTDYAIFWGLGGE